MTTTRERRRFGDVCTLVKGRKPSLYDEAASNRRPYLVAKFLRGTEPPQYADVGDRNAVAVSSDQIIVICDGSNSGETFIGYEGVLSSTMAKVEHGPELDTRYLRHFLLSVFAELNAAKTGAAIPHLDVEGLRTRWLPTPPLTEQRRIVAILDEAFTAIATAKANTEQNLANARAVFESGVDAEFERLRTCVPGRPLAEWVDDVSTGPFGSLLHKSDYVEGGIPLVNPINIEGEKIIPDPRKAVDKETASRLSRYVLQAGDIVTVRRGEIGRCAVIEPDQAGWLCGTGSFFIRPGKAIDPHFLTHLLRSAPYRSRLEGASARATMPSISNDDLNGLVVHVPLMAEQRAAEKKFRGIAEQTQRLESLAQQKLAALDALKASLLHHTFSGQLTGGPVEVKA